MRTIFHNIGSLQTMDDKQSLYYGKSIIVKNNRIEKIVDSINEFESSDAKFIDVQGRAIVPGFIDSHNHLIWSGDRFNEHKLRMEGKTYSEIAQLGGGIMETVRSTRESSPNELFEIGKHASWNRCVMGRHL